MSPRPTGSSPPSTRYDRPFKVFENFIFYPPVLKARELIDAGRDRRAAVDPHQVEPRAQRHRLGGAGLRQRLAQREGAIRRRAAGVRRRPSQIRARLAFHGRSRGGPRLHRPDAGPRRHALRRPVDDLLPFPRQSRRQSGDRLFARRWSWRRAITRRTTASRSREPRACLFINGGHGRLGDDAAGHALPRRPDHDV